MKEKSVARKSESVAQVESKKSRRSRHSEELLDERPIEEHELTDEEEDELEADAEREAEERDQRVTEIRERIDPKLKRLQVRSTIERDIANASVATLRRELAEGDLSSSNLHIYIDDLVETRSQIEGLQADAHLIPSNLQRDEIMNENYRALEAIHDLLVEIYGTQDIQRGVEQANKKAHDITEENSLESKKIIAQFRKDYGAHPEEIMSGEGGWKGRIFRMKHWLAQKATGKTAYDHYREARTQEEARSEQRDTNPLPRRRIKKK